MLNHLPTFRGKNAQAGGLSAFFFLLGHTVRFVMAYGDSTIVISLQLVNLGLESQIAQIFLTRMGVIILGANEKLW